MTRRFTGCVLNLTRRHIDDELGELGRIAGALFHGVHLNGS